LHDAPQLVEHHGAATQQSAAVLRELGSLRRAVEKPDAERMFEVADGLGNDRVRDRQAIGGARHAAGLGDG
jgi:hypothetical protein